MKIPIHKLIINAFFLGTLLLFAFVNNNNATIFFDYTVPYINGHPVVIHTIFAIVVLMFFAISKRKTRVDIIVICLLLKCILDFSHVLFNRNLSIGTYFWFFACTLVSFVVYFVFFNQEIDDKQANFYKKGIIVFGLILCAQTLYTALFCGVSYMDLAYKTAMVIPYGGTNVIAAILVPIMAMIINEDMARRFKIPLVAIFLTAIVLTKSRGGMLLAILVFLYLQYSFASKKNNKYLRYLLITLMLITFVLALLSNDSVDMVLSGYSSVTSSTVGINDILSGRLDVYKSAFDGLGFSDIFFGTGMQTITGSSASGAHNIVIDLIVRCGIIGTINYLVMVIYIIKRGKLLCNERVNSFFLMIIIIFINSLYEVCYFYYECDALLWMFIGIMMAQMYSEVNSNVIMNQKR